MLFKSESPEALGDAWLEDINPDSLQVVQGAFINPELAGAKVRGRGRAVVLGAGVLGGSTAG